MLLEKSDAPTVSRVNDKPKAFVPRPNNSAMRALRLFSGHPGKQLRRRIGHRGAKAVHPLEMLRTYRSPRLRRPKPGRRRTSDGLCREFLRFVGGCKPHFARRTRSRCDRRASRSEQKADRLRPNAVHAICSAGQYLLTIFIVRRHNVDASRDRRRDIAKELLDLRIALKATSGS